MPRRYGDAGLFICTIGDGGDPPDVKKSTPALHVPAPRMVWLVLSTCGRCIAGTGYYCSEHGPDNWWLTNCNLGFQIRNPRKTPGHTGVPDLEPQTHRKD